MKTFLEALIDGGWKLKQHGYWSLDTSGMEIAEITFEPCLFDEQHYLAAYDKDGNLLFEKIVIKPGKI